jgi:hypothetical protein
MAPLLAFALFVAPAREAVADGTETLGPASIPIAAGSGIVAAGTGLQTQPGTIEIDIPGNVVQAILYWSGGSIQPGLGDDDIIVDGMPVVGVLIGGPAYFYGQTQFSTYRADITGAGLVGPGFNSLTVEGMDFSNPGENNGAGLLVIFDDGSGTFSIGVVDGLDLAFFGFPEPRQTTVPQTFAFAPAAVDRISSLAMFFGSVSHDGLRPNEIDITFDVGPGITLINPLASNDGRAWDTLNLAVTIPAGASTLTVEAISTPIQDPLGASMTWSAAALALAPEEPPGGEGCTPGYWKNHLEDWPPTGLDIVDDFDTTFGVDLFDPKVVGTTKLPVTGRLPC